MAQSKSQRGRRSREYGGEFERKIGNTVQLRFPGTTARRTLQAQRAHESDLVIDGHPLLGRVWWECQTAETPDCLDKLAQAERDVIRAFEATKVAKLPVVVWHKKRSRSIWVTSRLAIFHRLAGWEVEAPVRTLQMLVTVPLDDFLAFLEDSYAASSA